MHRMVIICCLIAAGYAEIITPLHIRLPRQTSDINPHDIPTYPNYVPSNSQNQNKETMVESNTSILQGSESTAPSTIPQKSESTASTAVKKSEPSFLSTVKSYLQKFVLHGARAGNYLLQTLGAIFLGTSAFNMVCSYYPDFCSSLGIVQVRQNTFIYFYFSRRSQSAFKICAAIIYLYCERTLMRT